MQKTNGAFTKVSKQGMTQIIYMQQPIREPVVASPLSKITPETVSHIITECVKVVEAKLARAGSASAKGTVLAGRVRNISEAKDETRLVLGFENVSVKNVSYSDGKFVVAVDGTYRISFSPSVIVGTKNVSCYLTLLKNGTPISTASKFASVLSQDTMTVAATEDLVAGDELSVQLSLKGPTGSYAEINTQHGQQQVSILLV